MSQEKPVPTRFIGLDVHKHYLVAIGVDTELNQVLGLACRLSADRQGRQVHGECSWCTWTVGCARPSHFRMRWFWR